MRPKIVEQPDISGAAVAELKAWLGISRPNDDSLLEGLLHASLATCEDWIGQAPLRKTVEELIPNVVGPHCLLSRPVKSLIDAAGIAWDGTRTLIPDQNENLDVHASGSAQFTIVEQTDAKSVAIKISVGIADSWETVPPALKHATIRLAAFAYRERDQASEKQMSIPTSVSTLLQPWREMRLL